MSETRAADFPGRRVPATLLALAAMCMAVVLAHAADIIITRDGSRYEGQVVETSPQGVSIKLAAGQFTIPRDRIDRMQVEPPALVLKGIEAFERGNMKEAAFNLGQSVTKYPALDVGWASTGLLYYGRASLAIKDYAAAESTFKSFLDWYPDHQGVASARIGLAMVMVSKKEYEPALEKLREIAEPLNAELKPEGNAFAQAADVNLTMGLCYEGIGKTKEARDSYLKVVALYPAPGFVEEALCRAARLYAAAGDAQYANMLYTQLIEEYPASPFAREAIAERSALKKPAGGAK